MWWVANSVQISTQDRKPTHKFRILHSPIPQFNTTHRTIGWDVIGQPRLEQYLCPPIYFASTTGLLPTMRTAVFPFHKCSSLSIQAPASVPVIQTRSPPVVLMAASAPAVSPPVPCRSISYSPIHFLPVGPCQPIVFLMTASTISTGEFICLLLWLWVIATVPIFYPVYQSSSSFSNTASWIPWVYTARTTRKQVAYIVCISCLKFHATSFAILVAATEFAVLPLHSIPLGLFLCSFI